MRHFFFILVGCLFIQEAAAGADAFYVWQQSWSSRVQDAVEQEDPTTLYPIICTIPSTGEASLVHVPWDELSALMHEYIPVIRIPLAAFKRTDLSGELNRITESLSQQMSPIKLKEIQLDLDCPERLLDRYLELLATFRAAHPGLRLSITALPVHLNHDIFHELAAVTDFYVLQVHGINVPKTLNDPAELLNRKTANRALRQAEAIGRPYCVALPCYAYELNFNSDSGAFLFLTAEQAPRRKDTQKKRIAAKQADLIELQAAARALPHAKGVIWFRLPVDGDRLCLPRTALASIQSGTLPISDVHCTIRQISESTIEVELRNANTIHACQATLKLSWPNPAGASDLYNDLTSIRPVPGRLPTEIAVPLPPPGRSIKIGWFQAHIDNHPKIEMILK